MKGCRNIKYFLLKCNDLNQKQYICFSVERNKTFNLETNLIYQNFTTGDEDDIYGVPWEKVEHLKNVIKEAILEKEIIWTYLLFETVEDLYFWLFSIDW